MISLSQVAGFYVLAIIAILSACQTGMAASGGHQKHETPISTATVALMRAKQTVAAAPVLIRVYKKEAELEVWKRNKGGRFVRLKTFPICRWSGQLGPKMKEGDRQTPEGFYSVSPSQMNPNSAHYLSFDTGFPNAFDRAHGATGSALMVHGTCSSAGCFAMTDEGMGEIYALAREAFRGGQKAIQLQAYPFRMTAENLVRHRLDPNIAFWRQLKEGSDRFEATGQEPVVGISAGRYTFRPAKDVEKEGEVLAHRAQEDDHATILMEEGRPAIRTTYVDGGQHPSYAALLRRGVSLGEVSRPEALASAGRELIITPARSTRLACLGTGACQAPSEEVRGNSHPPAREGASATAPVLLEASDAPLQELPSLFTRLLMGGASRAQSSSKPTISGSFEILPAHLIKTPVTFAVKH
jgi:murein L,D-transpeptidase YafK